MFYIRFLLPAAVCLSAGACGTGPAISDTSPPASLHQALAAHADDDASSNHRANLMDADVITDSAFAAVVAEAEFTDRSNAPECLALRGQINVLRPALLAKAEWLSLVKTQAWQTLSDDYKAYIAASCPSVTLPVTEISETCATARAEVIADWVAVQDSSEYEVVDSHDALESLVNKWNSAIAADCISH